MTDRFGPEPSRPEMMNPEPTGPLTADGRGARWLRRRLAGGVAAMTTVIEDSFHVVTVSAVTIVSIEPLQYLVALDADSQMEGWMRQSRVFGLSFLSWKQQSLADRFAGFAPLVHPTFRDIGHFTAVTGAPLIEGCIGWADCRTLYDIETGDHRSFVGQAVAIGRGSGEEDDPLVYYLNRYRRLT